VVKGDKIDEIDPGFATQPGKTLKNWWIPILKSKLFSENVYKIAGNSIDQVPPVFIDDVEQFLDLARVVQIALSFSATIA